MLLLHSTYYNKRGKKSRNAAVHLGQADRKKVRDVELRNFSRQLLSMVRLFHANRSQVLGGPEKHFWFHLFFSILRPFPPSRQIAFKLWEKFPAPVSCWTMGQIGRRLSSVLDSSGHQTAITFHKTARYGNRRALSHLQLSF